MALPTSAIIYGPKNLKGFWSHSNVEYLETVGLSQGGNIVEDVDPRVFEQWCNNVWEMTVDRIVRFEYDDQFTPIPPEEYTDFRTFYRSDPFNGRWTTQYPIPQTVYQPTSDAYELSHPGYLPNPDPPNDDVNVQAPECYFYVKDGKLKYIIFPTTGTDLDSFTVTPDSITIESSRTINYGYGTRTETSTLIATITRRFYEPA